MHPQEKAEPVGYPFFTPGVFVLIALMVVGALFGVARFLFGLGAVTNLNTQFPWGLWIGIDVVTGVALAAGGFTTSALAYVFNREQFHAVIRPALLTAMLGYTFVSLGLLVDIGRYWNIWRPMVSWNPNSVLFEVAMCVMIYLTVLYIEFIPILIERFSSKVSLPGRFKSFNQFLEAILDLAGGLLGKIMFLFIIAGIVLSCLHQSALGSLMLIAAYKVHPLWYTPILPLLFLLSAIAVGYPMVVFESMIASRSLKREPEMGVLVPLARFMPLLIGIYLAFKLGDMVVRRTYIHLLDGTFQSNAFLVEVLLGVVLPFGLLLCPRVRKSAGWLFFASTLYVIGVVINRVNVFIVSYTPPYMAERYFPAIGEFAITIGFIAALIFLYRLFITLFPVLSTNGKTRASILGVLVAGGLILGAGTSARGAGPGGSPEKMALPPMMKVTLSINDAPKVRILNSPVVNTYSNLYGPVRFMHSKHANVVRDCTICHHRIQREETDTYGSPADMSALTLTKTLPQGCSSCHEQPWEPGRIHVPGLKGAYHQQCMGCHRESQQKWEANTIRYRSFVEGYEGAKGLVTRAPLDCLSCHSKKETDHSELVKLEDGANALDVTKNCLSCHETQGRRMLETVHWNWQGASPFTAGYEKRVDLGKRSQTINTTTLSLPGNWERCTQCHAGYGWKDETFDFSDMNRVDCLVCHDRTGTYKKSPDRAGMPESTLDLLKIATGVGRSSRATCGLNCHFSGGKTDPVNHGSMNPKLLTPERSHDVHMAEEGMNMPCGECHKTRKHRISGRSVADPPVEGAYSCQDCHTERPHIGSPLLSHHLNEHTAQIACQTCHIPVYGKNGPALTRWDWSTAGQDTGKTTAGDNASNQSKAFGTLHWKETVKPVYRWYDGRVVRHLIGDPVDEEGITEINRPEGRFTDPESKIYPFKTLTGKQISDPVHGFLIPPKLWEGYWEHGNWDNAARAGVKLAGLPYSGTYAFVETLTYQGINHEVLPKERALSCVSCHETLAHEMSCARCHKPRPEVDFKKLASTGIDFQDLVKEGNDAGFLIGRSDYVDFKALGYAGDPIEVGGRFKALPLEMGGAE